MRTTLPLVEPVHVPDVFVDGIASIETIKGGCLRVTLYVDREHGDGRKDREIVARLIGPISILPGIIRQLGTALAGYAVLADSGDERMLN